MIDRTAIEDVGKTIGKLAHAERVVLFGSYAKGEETTNSDVDFLVVAESHVPRHKRSRDLYRKIQSHPFPVDIVVYTPEEVRRGCRTPVSFVSQALRDGITVYER